MYRGRIVEMGGTDELFSAPAHPYTRELVDATPRLNRVSRVAPLAQSTSGEAPVRGCAYAARCPFARARCRQEEPALEVVKGEGRRVACWFPLY
jgi:oligopeptide/dipeptide ABC transporter ATP-binding protein